MKRRVEVFVAGCTLCEDALRVLRELACESCEIEVQDLRESEAARDRAAELGIQRVPAVAVDGKLAGCCEQVSIDAEALRAAGVGNP